MSEPGEGSFEPVYEATKARVWGVCRRVLRDDEDALDAFQSAYARLIGMARRRDLSADEADPPKLVVALAVREADSLRKRRWRRGRREIGMESASAAPDPAATPAEAAARAELRARLLAETDALPDRLRLPLLLHYYDGLTHEEIGRSLGAPATTVSSRIASARKRLERRMRGGDWSEALAALSIAPVVGGPLLAASEAAAGASAFAASKIFAAASGAEGATSAPALSLGFKLALAALAGGAAVGGYQLAQAPPPEPTVIAVAPRRPPPTPRPSPTSAARPSTQGGPGPARPVMAYEEPRPFARNVHLFGEFRGKTLFAIGGGDDPLRVWTSDGNAGGTAEFDIPFPAGSHAPRLIWILGALGDRVIFVADDLAHGKEPWATDGTAEGTRLLADTLPGPDFSWVAPLDFDREGGKLYFVAGGKGHEESTLWITDGSPEGTRAIKNLHAGSPSNSGMRTRLIDGRAYFEAVEGGERWLWNTNGQPEGTRRVHRLSPPRGESFFGCWPLRGLCYFADRGKIYATDGEGSGAALAIDVAGFVDELEPFVEALGQFGDVFYFAIYGGTVAAPLDRLFASDGTQPGTRLLREFPRRNPGHGVSFISFVALGGAAYFGAPDGETGYELWRTDGTPEGTRLLKDIAPGGDATGEPRSSNPFNLIPIGDGRRFIFSAMPTGVDQDGADLWISDGTEAGTRILQDLPRGAQPRFNIEPEWQEPSPGGFLFFPSRDWENGPAVWTLKLDAIR